MRAVVNYRNLLEAGSLDALDRELRDRSFDRTVRSAINRGRILTKDQVDRMVGRYHERSIKLRAEMIARTESLRAVHTGNYNAYNQAVENNHLKESEIVRQWISAGDNRVRPTHVIADGQIVKGQNTPFLVGGEELLYPGDPNAPGRETIGCRCVVTTTLALGP